MNFQKNFRECLRNFQKNVVNETEFILEIQKFPDVVDYYLIEDFKERERVEKLLKSIFDNSEPLGFVVNNIHSEDLFLKKLHLEIKKVLSKPVQLLLF